MLLNSRELLSYSAAAKDGTAGSVRDLLVTDDSWSVRYIVVDTEGFLSDNFVLLATKLVKEVKPPEQALVFDQTRLELENSIPASSAPPVSAHHNEPDILREANHDPHLRSAVEIAEYNVSASDGDLGQARGLAIEIATWNVRYVVVDTGEMLASNPVLLVPSSIRKIDWDTRNIRTNLTVAAVRACPDYDQESEITRQYEAFLHSHFGWQPYWQAD